MRRVSNYQYKKRFTALGVAIALLLSMLCPGTVNAAEAVEHVKIFVVSTETKTEAIWETIIYEDCVYVKENDLVLACGVGIEAPESVLTYNDETWIPLEECLNKLYFSSLFIEETRTLILRRTGLDKMVKQMEDIYKNSAYKMSSWQNMKLLGGLLNYEGSYKWAVATDVVTNFDYINLATGKYELDQYQSALGDIFLTELDGEGTDIIEAADASLNIFKTIAKGKKNSDNLFKVLFDEKESGFMGDLGAASGAFTKAADITQIEEVIKVNRYLEMVGGANVSYKNALEYILNTNISNDDCSTQFLLAAQDMLQILNEKEPAWKSYMKQVLYGVSGTVMDEIAWDSVKKIGEAIVGRKVTVNKAVTALEKEVINSLLHTYDQVDGTVRAHCQLDIQNMCRYTYNKYLSQYKNAADDAGKVDCLLKMHDLTQFYLASGICAWNAVEKDKDLAAAGADVISEMKEQQAKLCTYTPECFKYYEFNKEACSKLFAARYDEDITTDDLPGNTNLVKEIQVFGNRGYLSERTEYIYTADGLPEIKREYIATEDSYESDTMALSQETVYAYDEKGRISTEQIYDSEGVLTLTGTYSYDEEFNLLESVNFRDNGGTSVIRYDFGYSMKGLPIISGEYIWNNFRNMYFNGNIKNVLFQFGRDGEIVECMAYADNSYTGMPDCAIEYTCDESGMVISENYTDLLSGWGSYYCEYERGSRGLETVTYYYPMGDIMGQESYEYDNKDRIKNINVYDDGIGESYSILYYYY